MTELTVTAEPEGTEDTALCECCGRAMHDGYGVLRSGTDDLADYWYRWSDGHESRFHLAISACDSDGNPRGGLAVLSARLEGENLVYTVLEPQESPWPGSPVFGPVLTREQALSGAIVPGLFALVDAIVAKEERLSSRILATSGDGSRHA